MAKNIIADNWSIATVVAQTQEGQVAPVNFSDPRV
jgi:hypothetical protein